MAENSIKIRAKKVDDLVHVKTLIKHEMTSTMHGETSSPLFIQEVNFEHNGSTVFKANWGSSISKNPYLSFKFEGGNSGESITVSWIDNAGDTDSLTAIIG